MANERQNENRILSNREIRSRDVRLINEDGSNGGVVPFFTALNMAQDQGLDLIQINGMSTPPACKIGEVGKYKYEAQKKQTEQNKKNRENRVDIKEVQLRPAIGTHDLDIKVNKIKEWIADGDKVKVVIRFRGREMANQDVGFKLIDHIIATVPSARVEGRSEMQGNRLTAIISQAK